MMLSCRGAGVAPIFARIEAFGAWEEEFASDIAFDGIGLLVFKSLFLCCEIHRCLEASALWRVWQGVEVWREG